MNHLRSFEEVDEATRSVVSIGVFDGVHLGHQSLIQRVIARARERECISVVITFFPYPEMVLHGFQPGYYLTLPDEKASLLGQYGVDTIITLPFDETTRTKRADEFITDLKERLGLVELCVGPDFAFGYKRQGTIDFLKDATKLHGFDLDIIEPVKKEREVVSSSKIRQALSDGSVELAAQLLGRPFRLPGIVVNGDGRGRTIGIPTANLDIPIEQALPARGVYSAWAIVDEQQRPAVVNVGIRPTVSGDQILRVEAHLIDFEGDLYGMRVALDFVSRLRNEMKFDGIEQLVAQIKTDIGSARNQLVGA